MRRIVLSVLMCLVAITAVAQHNVVVKYDVGHNYGKEMVLIANHQGSLYFNPMSQYVDSCESTPEGKAKLREIQLKAWRVVQPDGTVTFDGRKLGLAPEKHIYLYVEKSAQDEVLTVYDYKAAGLFRYTEPIDDINEGEDLFNLQDDNTKEYTIEPVGFVKYLIKIEQGITNVDTNIEEIKEDKQENELKAKVKTRRKNKIEYFDLHPEIPLEDRHNFKIQNEDLGAGGKKEKYRNNVQAIRVLKQCENENRYATPEEQEILSKYVGWGGIPEVFDTRNDNWDAEYNELKSLLTEKEYEEARRSTLTAFYTPPIVIKSIYKALENMGLKRGNILEPSCRCTVISLE